jgi:hypothetical protein
MKILALLVLTFSCFSCLDKRNHQSPIIGTWELQTGMVIQKTDTVVTDYTKEQRLIKMINETHFSFLRHDLNKGKDSTSVFVAGGGAYSFDGKTYKEELEFCSGRSWEGKKFSFNVIIKKDTLIQRGIEKIEELGVEQTIVETYFRVKK